MFRKAFIHQINYGSNKITAVIWRRLKVRLNRKKTSQEKENKGREIERERGGGRERDRGRERDW